MKHLRTFEQYQINEGLLDSAAYNGALELIENPANLYKLATQLYRMKENKKLSDYDYNLFIKSEKLVREVTSLPEKYTTPVKLNKNDLPKFYKKGDDIKNLTYELLYRYVSDLTPGGASPSGAPAAGNAGTNEFQDIFDKWQNKFSVRLAK